jgi:hypothetical protein
MIITQIVIFFFNIVPLISECTFSMGAEAGAIVVIEFQMSATLRLTSGETHVVWLWEGEVDPMIRQTLNG